MDQRSLCAVPHCFARQCVVPCSRRWSAPAPPYACAYPWSDQNEVPQLRRRRRSGPWNHGVAVWQGALPRQGRAVSSMAILSSGERSGWSLAPSPGPPRPDEHRVDIHCLGIYSGLRCACKASDTTPLSSPSGPPNGAKRTIAPPVCGIWGTSARRPQRSDDCARSRAWPLRRRPPSDGRTRSGRDLCGHGA